MIKIQRIHPDAKLPVCAHPGSDLCWDLFAIEDVTLQPFQPTKVRTGLKMELPHGWGIIIRPRSGMSNAGIWLGGGEIDNGYRGEILVLLTHLPRTYLPTFEINRGDRIAQFRMHQIMTLTPLVEVDALSETVRGDGAFGSTGR